MDIFATKRYENSVVEATEQQLCTVVIFASHLHQPFSIHFLHVLLKLLWKDVNKNFL